jgi:hypothetical protein
MPGLTRDDLDEIFTHHPPTPEQGDKYVELRQKAHTLASTILELAPESAERTLAIRHVQEAVMFANAAIAIHGQ